ncbi:hypothetical protein PBI_SCTP2_64 [Salicola phage SCTP-2]|nr:hypothetical protein PBI_SCTP2_64 [Salicola phage SCTP-2]
MSFVIPNQSENFSKTQIRKMINRFYDIINKETYGQVYIERDPMRNHYDVSEHDINVHFPTNIKIHQVIHEVIYQLGLERTTGNKTPHVGIDSMIVGYSDHLPNLLVFYWRYDEQEDQYIYKFSFENKVLVQKK